MTKTVIIFKDNLLNNLQKVESQFGLGVAHSTHKQNYKAT